MSIEEFSESVRLNFENQRPTKKSESFTELKCRICGRLVRVYYVANEFAMGAYKYYATGLVEEEAT